MFAQLQHQHRQQHKAFYFRAFQCRLDLKPYVNHQNKIKCKKTKRGISKVIIVFRIMKFCISFFIWHVHLCTDFRFFSQFLAYFLTHQMAVSLFRLLGALLKTMVVANKFGMFSLLLVFLFGGFLIPRRKCLLLKKKYAIVENQLLSPWLVGIHSFCFL